MSKLKTFEEIKDSEKLCDHCPLDDTSKGVHCYGGAVIMCEGSHCNQAYENYVEDFEADENE